MTSRADLGFGDALGDLSGFSAKPNVKKRVFEKKAVEEVAKESGFVSREKPKAEIQRRRRTGRNTQFNIKAKPETIEEYCSIADLNGWGLGETLEYAVELLREFKK